MQYTIKDLQAQGLNKSLIYEALKTVWTFSKQFIKNKRVFDDKDIQIFRYYKQFGYKKTVLKFWTSQKVGKSKTVSNTSQTVWQNSFKTVSNREEELTQIIEQKETIIKIKDDQTQKYALLKQEEKKEKEEWIKKYDDVQNEKSEWVQKYYAVKMYMVVFLVLLILASILVVWFLIKSLISYHLWSFMTCSIHYIIVILIFIQR